MSKLTIISSNYKSKEILDLNYNISNSSCEWIVVCNDGDKNIGEQYTKLDGVDLPKHQPKKSLVNRHSLHHALALNKACKFVLNNRNTDYVLFCDPDFFVIPEHDVIIEYMKHKNIKIFGAPYWPDHKTRPITNFPVAFCMYVDVNQIDISTWDFAPVYHNNIYMDTGHKIYEQYYLNTEIYESVIPQRIYKYFPQWSDVIGSDTYFWQSQLFGIHMHMKVHLKNTKSPAMKYTLKKAHRTIEFINYVKQQYNTSF